MFKIILKNKIITYLLSRYGTYAIQFIVSMVIAAKLGPYYFGVYGFLTLILNYFSQINFGIPHSLNVLLVHNKGNNEKCKQYIGNSLAFYGVISLIVVCIFCFIYFKGNPFNSKYSISSLMIVLLCCITILQYFALLCTTILRVRNKVNQLAIAQSSSVFLNLAAVIFFRDEILIYSLLISQLISFAIFLFFTYQNKLIPNVREVQFKFNIQKHIINKGFFLFIYNSCFYFIFISIRSIINNNYSIEEFGIFNFSYTLSHAILLLIEALTTILFPKIIDLLSSKDFNRINASIENIRIAFVSTSHLLIYIAMLFFPLITAIMPEFKSALVSMNLIALAVLMNTNSYGYSSFLIAQNKERISAFISLISLIINIVLAELLVVVYKVEFSYVIISVMITYFIFSLLICVMSRKIMGVLRINNIINDFFPIRLLIPYTVALTVSILSCKYLIIAPLILFICLNINDIKSIILLAKKVIKNPNIADI